jgi:hypothetical protein
VVDVATKLQIKPSQSVFYVAAPSEFAPLARPVAQSSFVADAVIGFATKRSDIAALTAVIAAAEEDRLAWVAYPKAGQLDTDLNRDVVREEFASRGLHTVRQIAIDEVWSALRFRPA